MSRESDDVYVATADEVQRVRENECAQLEAQLIELGRQYRALVAQNTAHREECAQRLNTLRWIREQPNHPDAGDDARRVILDQIISRVGETLSSGEVS